MFYREIIDGVHLWRIQQVTNGYCVHLYELMGSRYVLLVDETWDWELVQDLLQNEVA